MAWPTHQDYNEAVQNPRLAFNDLDLRNGQPELNLLGIPRPISGNFACVYKIQNGSHNWAARCFVSEVQDQQRRYEAISVFLAKVALPYTIPFTYLPTGIKVHGRHYPLLKMQWVQGESLNTFVARSIGYPDTLLSLAKVWLQMMSDLKTVSLAHGDLQHGNILVVGDQLRLIDYDGVFVPSLSGKQSNEIGHRNYQLPTRSEWDYGPYLDNFSAWVIYVSLVALAIHPELWNVHRGGDECLILRKEDFLRPENSALLRDLNASPNRELRLLVEMFTSLVNLAPQDVPALDGSVLVTPGKRTVVSSKQEWWVDHVETRSELEQTAAQNAQEPGTVVSVSDPGWILDSLKEGKPVEALIFKNNLKQERVVIVGSMVLMFLTRLLIDIPTSQLLIVASFVFGLTLLHCFVRYKSDPSTAELDAFKRQAKLFVGQVRKHQAVIDAISKELRQIQDELVAGEEAIADQKQSIILGLQTSLGNIEAALNSQLHIVNERRREFGSSEKSKLNELQGTLGLQISGLDRRIAGLNQKEADEKGRAIQALQDIHIQNYLRSHNVLASKIPNVGEAFQSRLFFHGFKTAADINASVIRVSGIGPKRENALRQWRQQLEQEARMCGPSLSAQERLAIESKFRNERQALAIEKEKLQTQFEAQVASVRAYFANQRQAMNQEEQQLRAAYVQTKAEIQRAHNAETVVLNRRIIDAKNRAAPAIADLSQKLQAAQKQVFDLRWQVAKHEKEGRGFARLRFRDYLQAVNSPQWLRTL
jgi:hypothetical protein